MLIYRFKKKKLVEFCPVHELCSDLAQNGSCSLKDSRLRSCQDLVLCLPRAMQGVGSCGKEDSSLPAWRLPTVFPSFWIPQSWERVQGDSRESRTVPPLRRSGGSLPGCHVIHGMARRCRFWLWKYIYIHMCVYAHMEFSSESICFKGWLMMTSSYTFSYSSSDVSNIQIHMFSFHFLCTCH